MGAGLLEIASTARAAVGHAAPSGSGGEALTVRAPWRPRHEPGERLLPSSP